MMERMEDPVVEAARRYLQTKHCTLWGEALNIHDDMEAAAQWLAGEVRAVMRQMASPGWTDQL